MIPSGPCDWPLSFVECQDKSVLDSLTEEDRGLVTDMAVDLLWRWTGRRFGLCPHTIRPQRRTTSSYLSNLALRNQILPGAAWGPVLVGGEWFNVSCGAANCGRTCRCCHPNVLTLPSATRTVSEVVIGETTLDPSDYYMEWQYDGPPLLIKREGHWPLQQELNAPLGEPGTWSVTLTRGQVVPVGGQVAAGLLALEFAKALCKDSTCQLPSRMQTVTRQGVTVAVLDTMEDLDRGRTGIYLVDNWVASVMKAPGGSAVYSVDVKPRRRSR